MTRKEILDGANPLEQSYQCLPPAAKAAVAKAMGLGPGAAQELGARGRWTDVCLPGAGPMPGLAYRVNPDLVPEDGEPEYGCCCGSACHGPARPWRAEDRVRGQA